LLRVISRAKRGGNPQDTNLVEAIAAYRRALRAANTVDFDDLIGLTVDMLKASPILAEHYRSRFRFISVDEFQDLDAQQYLLLTLLAPADANICVIGDPDQAIYGFRGADASCFERFRRDYPHAATVCLARNYRSSGTIVTASAQVLAAVRSDAGMAEIVRDMYERITIHAAATERAEAEFVVASIERLIGGHTFFSLDSGRSTGARADFSFSDFAVLYRTDAQSAALIEAFGRSGIPFKKHRDVALGDDPSVQALQRTMETLDETTEKTIVDALKTAASQLERKDQAAGTAVRSALQRLARLAQTCEGKHLFDAIALANDVDLFDPRADRVSLLTLHAAKGLEFPVVFITGLEDGLLPLHWGQADPASAAEERRLFYVGMTRAKDQLILTRALARLWRGRVCEQSPSPYLADIERELLTYQRNEVPRRRPENRQLSLF
jgi:DNA helicase-2/ATP-dependent DNA helicase PcrA